MQPGTLPLPLRRNAVDRLRLELKTLDDDGDEIPFDLTGHSLMLEVRLYPGAPGAALLTASTGNDAIVIEDAAGGVVEIDWPGISAAIAALPSVAPAGDPSRPRVDTFSYDLLVIAGDGQAQAILEGSVPVSFGVTRP